MPPPRTTRCARHIGAPPAVVYRLLTDAAAVRQWKVPDGKTSGHTDTYHGRFVSLVPGARVVEAMEFETDAPALRGEMTITYTLAASGAGTELVAVHEGVPEGVSLADNEAGWRMSMDKLKALAEATPA